MPADPHGAPDTTGPAVPGVDQRVPRQERHQVLADADRADARAAAAVRDAEGLVQVEVADVGAEAARLGQPDHRVEVGAVDVDLTAGVVHGGADLLDVDLEDAVRRRVGEHDRGQPVGVLVDLGVQVGDVDVAGLVAGDDDDPHAGHDGAGGVGAVRGARDQADVALLVAAGVVVAADGQQPGELALRAGVGLHAHRGVAGDLGQRRRTARRSAARSRAPARPGRTGAGSRTPAR